MAKRVAGVTEKLMECAKEEFLANGYENASLRIIAEKAGSSKGAIYIRHPDKESLYRSLVQPAADGFCELLQSVLSGFTTMPGNEQTQQMLRYGDYSYPMTVPLWLTVASLRMSGAFPMPRREDEPHDLHLPG